MTRPILYSFRRCPYAMRARLAIASAGVQVELREILLRDKAPQFLDASPSGTVPCLVNEATIIDESRDIMVWALSQSDPDRWLDMPQDGWSMMDTIEGPFKTALDRYKYSSRYQDADKTGERTKAATYLYDLDKRLRGQDWLFGATASLADMAILPFVRQFAMTDKAWFDAQPWPQLSRWLETFLTSAALQAVMSKYPVWKDGDEITFFPPSQPA